MRSTSDEYFIEIEKLKIKIRLLEMKNFLLSKYVEHDPPCSAVKAALKGKIADCDCGLDEVLKQ